MPELPEVQTTVDGVNEAAAGLKILDVWTDYNSSFHAGKNNIKNPKYFQKFKKEITGAKIKDATRRGKNVLIHLGNPSNPSGQASQTILIHMKMTGHLLYGKYELVRNKEKRRNEWVPVQKSGPLRDPFNKHIHLVFILNNKYHLAFSDLRRFAKVYAFPTKELETTPDLKNLGLEPLAPGFTFAHFKERLLQKPKSRVKPVLMDQTLITGIGNIYSDEILFEAGVHPESHPGKIPDPVLKKMFTAALKILRKGINFGGDSDSDYRNIYGEKGKFQHTHKAYRQTGKPCPKKDRGMIERKMIAGRSAHFCSVHQKLYK
jgi:formamidopyrimidine-DNA glycosylase